MPGLCRALLRQDICAVSCSWDVTSLPGRLLDVTCSRTFPGVFFSAACQSCCELCALLRLRHGAQTQRMTKLERLFSKAWRRGGNVAGEVTGPNTGVRQNDHPSTPVSSWAWAQCPVLDVTDVEQLGRVQNPTRESGASLKREASNRLGSFIP